MRARWIAESLLVLSIVVGTLSDRPHINPRVTLGGFRVLAADFHVHCTFPGSGVLAPWDIVLEARRRGLDALAITPHNQVIGAKIGRWFAKRFGGPTILVGEEIRNARFHVIAVGIEQAVSARQPASSAIDEVHRQRGVAIAAHPVREFWPGYDAAAMQKLDGSEVLHPLAYHSGSEEAYAQLVQFYTRRKLTAIGSSDYHALSALGLCRTLVFVREDSEQGVLEALRAGRTVVIDRDARAYGDPELVPLALADPRAREMAIEPDPRGFLAATSRIFGIAGLFVALILKRR